MANNRATDRALDAVMVKVAAARRRIGLSLFVARLGPSLLIAGIVAAVLVVLVKVFAHRVGYTSVSPVVWVGVVGLPMVLGCLVAAVSARRHWPTRLHAASALDDVAGTHDALGSSLAIAARGIESGFERLSVEQGEIAVERAVPNDVARIRFGASALYGAGCVALAGLLAVFAPMRTSETVGPQPIVRVQTPEAVSDAIEKLAEAKEVIESAASVGQASDKELQAIAELERELEEGLRDPEDAVAAAAQTLEQAADNAAERAAQERLEADAMRERLRSIDSEQFESARELAEDLSAGDFESAAEEAESLLEQMRADPEQAEQIADELRELADRIEQDRETTLADQDQARDTPESEKSPTENQLREQLEREGVPPEEAERLAEEYQREQEEQQAEEDSRQRGEDRADEIAKELREAADGADEESGEPEDGSSEVANDEGEPSDQQGEQKGDEPGDTPETQPGESEGEPQDGNQEGDDGGTDQQPGEGSEEGTGETPQPGQAEGQDEGEGAEPSPGGDQGQPNPGQPGGQPGDQPSNQPGQENGGDPGGAGHEQADQEGPPSGDGSGVGEGAKRGLGDVLRENVAQEQSTEDAESAAERFREQADRLTGSGPSDPLDELAQLSLPNSPWDGKTEFVDAREDAAEMNENERTIAEWFSPGNDESTGDSVGEVGPQQVVRQAEERAQRAIEQQTVPRRHADVIKRVFDRLAKQAQAAQPAPPVVQDAEDAP